MNRDIIAVVLIIFATALAFLAPQYKYSGLDVLSQVNIPAQLPGWKSIDVSREVNLKEERYNFISNAFVRIYRNIYGEELQLTVLDAGNFHNPKVCYTTTGFKVKDLEDAALLDGKPDLMAKVLDMQRAKDNLYVFYWLCIDRKITDWTGQKITELFSTLINKKKAGLIVRIEIVAQGRTPSQVRALAKEFAQTLYAAMKPQERAYVFGE